MALPKLPLNHVGRVYGRLHLATRENNVRQQHPQTRQPQKRNHKARTGKGIQVHCHTLGVAHGTNLNEYNMNWLG